MMASFVEWGLLASATLLFTTTEQWNGYSMAGLVILAIAWMVRAKRTGKVFLGSGLEGAGGLFLVSAGLAAWISYLPGASTLQFARYLAAAALFESLISASPAMLRLVAVGLVGSGTALAIYWPLQHDYLTDPLKFEVLNRLGRGLQTALPRIDFSALTGTAIHANVAAGTMALLLPIALGLAIDLTLTQGRPGTIPATGRTSWRILGWLTGGCAAVILGGVVLTGSRGAWLGLAGAGGLSVLAGLQRRFWGQYRRGFWAVMLALGLLGVLISFQLGWLERALGSLPDPTGSLQNRFQVWQQGLSLFKDTPFTGIGLMSFWLNHSTYALLIHIPFLAHSHNAYLQIGIEQGLPGLIALAGLLFAGLRRADQIAAQSKIQPFAVAGITAMAVAAIHGMVDVVFSVERTLPLVGLVAGFAFWTADADGSSMTQTRRTQEPVLQRTSRLFLPVSLLSLVVILTLWYGGPTHLAGAWFANLGALEQARGELSAYDPNQFDNSTLDQIRQQVDLSAAEADFTRALSLDPNNETARQRLAALALSRAEYDQASQLLSPIFSQEGNLRFEPVSTLLISDALVAQGRVEQGAQYLRGIAWASERLQYQAWYRYWQSKDYQRAVFAWEAVLLLEPGNSDARYWLKQAKAKLNPK